MTKSSFLTEISSFRLEQAYSKQQSSNLESVFFVAAFFLLTKSSDVNLLFRAACELDRDYGKLL